MKKDVTKPCKELEDEIMGFIFSKQCTDHRAALEVWNNNPWKAVSMYELEHYPENLRYQLAFPAEVEVPQWYLRKLQDEEMMAMKGEPIVIGYPRSGPDALELDNGKEVQINKFGRVLIEDDDEERPDF